MNEAIKTTYLINVNKFITKIGLLNRAKRVNINHNGVLLTEKPESEDVMREWL